MKQLTFLLLIACSTVMPTFLQAQDSIKTKKKMEMRKALREKWQNATPEEREKMKERAKEMKAKYDSLPPEKKAEIKEKLKKIKEAKKDE